MGGASWADNQEEDGNDDEEKSGTDDDVDWEELYAFPLTVRFTQEKVHPFFYRRGPIVNVVPKIRVMIMRQGAGQEHATLGRQPDSEDVYELVPPFSPIHCLRKDDELWSLDNRRLYALQLAAMEQWPVRCRVRLLCSDRLPRRKLKTQWRKFQTTSEGRAISICARFQQFDTWSWFDRAVEIEWFNISQRLSSILNIFEMLPVAGALLFRTGITGYSSRVPFVMSFALAFGIDLVRQKVTVFEKKISEFQVKAVMDGELLHFNPCGQRFQPGEAAMSAHQLAAIVIVVLALLLPYILGLDVSKLRSSLFSFWLGVASVLAVQLVMIMRNRKVAQVEYAGVNQRLSPKHR